MRAIAVFLIWIVSTTAFAQGRPLRLSPPQSLRPLALALPLPRPRPPEAGPGAVVTLSSTASPDTAAAEPAPPSECFLALTGGLALATPLPPIAEPNGCEAPDVLRLDAVILRDRRRVTVTPPATLRCAMATAIANWVRDDLSDIIAPLAGIDNFDSFECRGRNRIVGSRTSEHGRANALDIRALVMTGGQRIELTNPEVAIPLREKLRASACAHFTTVLGPGSDGYHENHVHVDFAERRNGFRLCQWEVREPQIPLPRERPLEAPAREH